MTILNPWPEHKNPSPGRIASAPYNFVPLPEKVISAVSDASELPEHDEYDRESHSGYFDVTLTTRSPLYIRGPLSVTDFQRQEQDTQAKNKPEFFHTGNERTPVIPGSSLRGMLRSLLEIVSYSKVQWVSEKQLFFRTLDDTVLGERYRGRMSGRVETGFLIRRGDEYFIKVCSMARVMRSLVGEPLYNGAAPNRFPRWQGEKGQPRQYAPVWVRVKFQAQTGRNAKPNIVEELSYQRGDGMREGRLVITGDIPKKKKEFVFLLPANDAEEINVPSEILSRFHDEDQLTRWQEEAFPTDRPVPRYRERNGMLGKAPAAPGTPIFFLRENGKLTFIGRAQMFRLPYMRSPFDLVDSTLRSAKQIDYAEALFGFVRTQRQLQELDLPLPKQGEKGRAYAGRVIVTDAVLQSDPADIWLAGDFGEIVVPRILASPKPTAFQHYLTQQQPDNARRLDHYDSGPSDNRPTTTIRGHKLYWHQGLGTDLKTDQKLTLEQIRATISEGFAQAGASTVDTQHTQIKPLKPEVTFSFRVHFENLSERELGALCWTLHPRGEPGQRYCHHLGMGKPLGMGAVELHARLHLINRSQRYTTLFHGDSWQLGESVVNENASLKAPAAEVATGEDLTLPDVLERLTKPFEEHLLRELNPLPKCTRLADMLRIAMLLKLLEWPGYRAVESQDNEGTENPPRPNTRYMKIQPVNEYLKRFVLPNPTQFDSSYFEGKSRPQGSEQNARPAPVAGHLVPNLPAKDPDMQKAENAIHDLEVLRESEVAGQIYNYYQRWQQLKSVEARKVLALAIIAKVRKAKREEASAKKPWYQELLTFLSGEGDAHAASG